MNEANSRSGTGEGTEEYEDLVLLDDLESLLEELEESESDGEYPPRLNEQLYAYDLANISELRDRIGLLHKRMDAHEEV